MIVCHCNRIGSDAITGCAKSLAQEDPWRILTPVHVYRCLGKRPECGGCLSLAAQIITDCLATERKDKDICATCPAANVDAEFTAVRSNGDGRSNDVAEAQYP